MVESINMTSSNHRARERLASQGGPTLFGLSNEIKLFNQSANKEGWSISLDSLAAGGVVFKRGLRILSNSGPMLVAVCLNNGYYTRERIRHLLEFAAHFSNQVTIFFTDGPAVHNYMAWGSDREEALRKARKQRNRLQNACIEATEHIKQRYAFEVSFIDWADIYRRRDYQHEYERLSQLFSLSSEFSTDLVRETEQALSSHEQVSDHAIEIASKYPLEELAFLLTYNKIAAEFAGSQSQRIDFAYLYHLRWPLLENLVDGKYDGFVRSNLGFVILRTTESVLRLVHS
jgi:tRNA-dependent cyclodipeptide synthase